MNFRRWRALRSGLPKRRHAQREILFFFCLLAWIFSFPLSMTLIVDREKERGKRNIHHNIQNQEPQHRERDDHSSVADLMAALRRRRGGVCAVHRFSFALHVAHDTTRHDTKRRPEQKRSKNRDRYILLGGTRAQISLSRSGKGGETATV